MKNELNTIKTVNSQLLTELENLKQKNEELIKKNETRFSLEEQIKEFKVLLSSKNAELEAIKQSDQQDQSKDLFLFF